jgi:RHS repeat-associated protein
VSLQIQEENNYYPFGLKHKGYNTSINGRHHKYMFGGKELQDEILGSSSFEVYDFGARNYDAALGRWMNLDPLAEKMRRHSPYNLAFNNPIYFIDPDGMAPGPPGPIFGIFSGVRNFISKTVETIKNSKLTVYDNSAGIELGKLGGTINYESKEVFSISKEGYKTGNENTTKSGYSFSAGVFDVGVSETKTVETKDINIEYSSDNQKAIVPGKETKTKTVNEGTASILGFGGTKSKTTKETAISQTMGDGSSMLISKGKVVTRDEGLNYSVSRNVNVIEASANNLLKEAKLSIGLGYQFEWSTNNK